MNDRDGTVPAGVRERILSGRGIEITAINVDGLATDAAEDALAGKPAASTEKSLLEQMVESDLVIEKALAARSAIFKEIAAQTHDMKIEGLGGMRGIKLISIDEEGDETSRTFEVSATSGPWLRDQLMRIFPR